MKTLMATKDSKKSSKPEYVASKWYIVDATGLPLGRLASQVAAILRGKNKPIYTPHTDCGDHVVIINSDNVVLTGKKLETKIKRRHSGYMGGMKETSYRKLMGTKPEKAFELAIKGMLPKNAMGRQMFRKLKVYAGPEHEHAAQKPQPLSFDI